jgi:hypothetical protein
MVLLVASVTTGQSVTEYKFCIPVPPVSPGLDRPRRADDDDFRRKLCLQLQNAMAASIRFASVRTLTTEV